MTRRDRLYKLLGRIEECNGKLAIDAISVLVLVLHSLIIILIEKEPE